MCNKYLYPDTDQDEAADDLDLVFKDVPESVSHVDACKGEEKGDDADDDGRGHDKDLQE